MASIKTIRKNDAEKLFVEAEHHEQKGDLKHAFRCYLAAAKLGDSSCQVNTGNYYSSGQGVKKDLKEAARWYRLAYRMANDVARIIWLLITGIWAMAGLR